MTIDETATEPMAREYPWWRGLWSTLKCELWHRRLKRWIPRLVWLDDEIDVCVHFKDIGALGGDPRCIFEVDQLLHHMGLQFDTGSGCDGRDWFWDWSLSGPISVTFRGRAKNPEKRIEHKAQLTVIK